MTDDLSKINFDLFYSAGKDPLNKFYIPALKASIRYDRSAGFFSSSALAVAASGVARLIQNGGRMRLLVGADLSREDVEAIRQGYDSQSLIKERLLDRFTDPEDALMKERLAVLAWMVAEGTLEIKVVLPKDMNGLPIPADVAQDYYHPKTGIFTDMGGNQVAFSGSVNESETAWKHNYEQFSVYTSWAEGKAYLPIVIDRFEKMWNNREPDWISLTIPKAIRDRLLKYCPDQAPTHDPLETAPIEETYIGGSKQVERILFKFLRDGPYLPNAKSLGTATAPVQPWPHQSRVVDHILSRFPEPAILCDEVGLGKTIEAGLILRQLLISGRVKRVLILAPKSVVRQWQEELFEKFALNIPRYDMGRFLDRHDEAVTTNFRNGYDNPWDNCDILISGSQLAKRVDRRSEILSARGWDLVIVDEAHHARRKDFKERIYRPNRLLSLLTEMKAHNKVGSLLLMTATPMQIHPLELWDLLRLAGMGGRWGADEDNFLDFFQEMRKSFHNVDWEFVYDLVLDYLQTHGQIDDTFKAQALADIGPIRWATIAEVPYKVGKRLQLIHQLGRDSEPHIKEMARRHTPLNHFIFRNTRALLREYEHRGILRAQVPKRIPRIERVTMSPEEKTLYDRIDEYITHFYHKYENERRGLGFVMTVYRRRLTSSFFAVRCSLERRLAYLRGQLEPEKQFTDDDIEQEELDLDIGEEIIDPVQHDFFQVEKEYVEDFIQNLQLLAISDSKMDVLKSELANIFHERNSVLIFTQYTDTMDFIRDQLCAVYGTQIACYSGRGGEMWNGIAWVLVSKEEVKTAFRNGDVRVLIGTESASEGLNLQTCGVLINYDMPWNPMRVEQRIGRIDRIGQEHTEVWITNYFYRDSIEDQIYDRLSDRINWFEVVVGDLQPILAEVNEATNRLAMLQPSERSRQLDTEIAALRLRLQNRELEALNLDDYLEEEENHQTQTSPILLEQIETMLTQSNETSHLFEQDTENPSAYWLSWKGEKFHVTFSSKVFDEHPDTIRFLTYGDPLFEAIAWSIPDPEFSQDGNLLTCRTSGAIRIHGWYTVRDDRSGVDEILNFQSLLNCCTQAKKSIVTPGNFHQLPVDTIRQHYNDVLEHQVKIIHTQVKAEYLALRARAQTLLLHGAIVEIAIGKSPELFETELYPSTFSESSIHGLERHGYPWKPLLSLAYFEGMKPQETDPFYQEIQNDRRDILKGRFNQLIQEARLIVQELSSVKKQLNQISDEWDGEPLISFNALASLEDS